MPGDLPHPPLPICLDLPDRARSPEAGQPDLSTLPRRPGVFVLEAEDGGTVGIAITADLRRRLRARLGATSAGSGARPSRGRDDERDVIRRVRAVTVGSMLEADWTYLQLARRRLPATYRELLDRWRAWFIHVDPSARFPRLVRTSTAHRGAAPDRPGVHLGPFPDKHAAQRGVDVLQDLFDLCRYHNILVTAPQGAACAYKEMGRCPAPCDGTITLDAYREMITAALDFAAAPDRCTTRFETRMQAASAALDFEAAAGWRRRLETARVWATPPFRHVARLEQFRFVAVAPAERPDRARLLLVLGGWVAPWADVPADDTDDERLVAIWDGLRTAAACRPLDLSNAGLENIGLVSWHLFQPAANANAADFIRLSDDEGVSALARAIRRVTSSDVAANTAAPLIEGEIDAAGSG